jgi:ABC-type nitrate/sulfonate/bicarbonate transport system substrate-binding protein
MEKVKVAVTSFSPNMLDMLLAEEQGVYAAQGLEVEWVPLGGEKAGRALVRREVDFAIQIAAALRLVMMEGARLKVVLIIHKDPPHWLMARPGISSVQDLKGKTVGAGARGSDSAVLVEAWLERHGLKPGVDVQVTYHPTQPDWARGWIRMTDDVPMAIPLEREMLETKGWSPLVELTSVFPGLLSHGLVVTEDSLEKRPETVQKLIQAHRSVVKYIGEAPQEVIACIQKRWEIDRDSAVKSYNYLCRVFVAELEPHHLQPVISVTAKELGKDPLEPETFMEPRLLREVTGA